MKGSEQKKTRRKSGNRKRQNAVLKEQSLVTLWGLAKNMTHSSWIQNGYRSLATFFLPYTSRKVNCPCTVSRISPQCHAVSSVVLKLGSHLFDQRTDKQCVHPPSLVQEAKSILCVVATIKKKAHFGVPVVLHTLKHVFAFCHVDNGAWVKFIVRGRRLRLVTLRFPIRSREGCSPRNRNWCMRGDMRFVPEPDGMTELYSTAH